MNASGYEQSKRPFSSRKNALKAFYLLAPRSAVVGPTCFVFLERKSVEFLEVPSSQNPGVYTRITKQFSSQISYFCPRKIENSNPFFLQTGGNNNKQDTVVSSLAWTVTQRNEVCADRRKVRSSTFRRLIS